MGFIGSLLSGPKKAMQANLQTPATEAQANALYGQAQSGLEQQQNFLNALQAQNGIQNQSNVFNQQQALANQFQNIGNGQGPNPALAQLNQATGQNIANQAALMAGQRGSSANVGLLARQAAQQGGALQQQAVGQGATLQAQQQLAALNALQNQQGMLGNLATQQVGQQGGALNNLNQLTQNEQGSILNQINAQNNARLNQSNQVNQMNMQQNKQSGDVGTQFLGGGLNALGGTAAKIGSAFMAHGGEVGCSSTVGKHLYASHGAVVPGRAEVAGDSLKNDKVPARLSPGEIVLPRTVAQHKDAPEMAKKFVEAIKAKNKMRK